MPPREPEPPIEDVVAALPLERVAALLLAAAERHRDVEHEARIAAARATGDLAPVKAAVRAAVRLPRGFLDYRGSVEWAAAARPVVEELVAWADDAPSAELVDLLQRTIERLHEVLHRADDSGGHIGDLPRDLLDAHARACAAGVADAKKLARWIVRFTLDDHGFLEADPVAYAGALGDRGLAILRDAVDAHRPQTAFAVGYLRQRLAVVDRDPDALVRLVGGDLHHAGMFLAVAHAMAEIERPDLVLEWTGRGLELEGWQLGGLCDLACATHEQLGAPLEALRLRRAHHERAPTAATYAALRDAASGLGTWDVERDAARATLHRRDTGEFVRALLADGDPDEAWTVAEATDDDLGDRTWKDLADRRADTAPEDALAVYLRLADRELVDADRRHYARAIRLLKQARETATAADRAAAFEGHLVELRMRHRRRPSLMEMLDRAGLTGAG